MPCLSALEGPRIAARCQRRTDSAGGRADLLSPCSRVHAAVRAGAGAQPGFHCGCWRFHMLCLEGEDESVFVSDCAGCDDCLNAPRMHWITDRIATGAQAGDKVGGFSLHAGANARWFVS